MGTEIHPTAVVDSKAELGADVKIGPYCVIYAGAKIGDGCWLQNHVTVEGPSEIGPKNKFYAYTSIGQQTQDLKYEAEPTYLKIGEGNTFREFCTVNRATSPNDYTIIGSHGNFLAYSHIGHDCIVGDHVIFSNNGTLGGHVIMGDHAILGGLTAVHQFCKIGAHVITGGCSKIVKDIPPFMMADGNPAKVRAHNAIGLQRRGFSDEAVASIKESFKILYRQNNTTTQALEKLEAIESRTAETQALIDFVKSSDRGIH
ncbi:MAG: acyl-ACP--UDP-N-acetylglucosamine O-acyltransferase [Verrucomicrobiales bacterium]|nr:acyl-ACP--UDP-N-acetylglucosamine O-acyltransferase [Verrucomicrobiales bacterium]